MKDRFDLSKNRVLNALLDVMYKYRAVKENGNKVNGLENRFLDDDFSETEEFLHDMEICADQIRETEFSQKGSYDRTGYKDRKEQIRALRELTEIVRDVRKEFETDDE